MNRTASASWRQHETDDHRIAILNAADRLLSGAPRSSSGNLSIVQLAKEANVKYWVVAQKHTDLRDHFQRLAVAARTAASQYQSSRNELAELRADHNALKKHCTGLEQLLRTYAIVINELTTENEALKVQAATNIGTVTPLVRVPRTPHSS